MKRSINPPCFVPDEMALSQNTPLYHAIVEKDLAFLIAQEKQFVSLQNRHVDTRTRWKFLKRKDQLNFYIQKNKMIECRPEMPRLLGVGSLKGKLEDLMYGKYDKTTEEFQMTSSFLIPQDTINCAVLHTFDSTQKTKTTSDPFRYFGLKWALYQARGSIKSKLIRHRDTCFLEYMGIKMDPTTGERYGFQIFHSLDEEQLEGICPPFNTKSNIVRAKFYYSYLFRESKDDGKIDVYMQASFDPCGDLMDFIATSFALNVLSSVGNAIQASQAKKLTYLHRQHHHDNTTKRGNYCKLCTRPKRLMLKLRKRKQYVRCGICDATVCTKCCGSQVIFDSKGQKVKVHCCKNCIVRAHTLVLNPSKMNFTPSRDNRTHQMPMEASCSPSFSSFSHSIKVRPATRAEAPVIKDRSCRATVLGVWDANNFVAVSPAMTVTRPARATSDSSIEMNPCQEELLLKMHQLSEAANEAYRITQVNAKTYMLQELS